MVSSSKVSAIFMIFFIAVIMINTTESMPSILGKRFDALGGLDFIQICLNNCAQCKKMFGNYFQGKTCAESCIKFSGKAIPDCEDIGSIAPFLNTYE